MHKFLALLAYYLLTTRQKTPGQQNSQNGKSLALPTITLTPENSELLNFQQLPNFGGHQCHDGGHNPVVKPKSPACSAGPPVWRQRPPWQRGPACGTQRPVPTHARWLCGGQPTTNSAREHRVACWIDFDITGGLVAPPSCSSTLPKGARAQKQA